MTKSPLYNLFNSGAVRASWWVRPLLMLIPGTTITSELPGGTQKIVTKQFRGKTYIIEVRNEKS